MAVTANSGCGHSVQIRRIQGPLQCGESVPALKASRAIRTSRIDSQWFLGVTHQDSAGPAGNSDCASRTLWTSERRLGGHRSGAEPTRLPQANQAELEAR